MPKTLRELELENKLKGLNQGWEKWRILKMRPSKIVRIWNAPDNKTASAKI